MARRLSGASESDHVRWWKDKLHRMGDRTFVMPKYGPKILDLLLGQPGGIVKARTFKELGARLGIPLKFVPRAVASVTRLGIVTARLGDGAPEIRLHRDRLTRRKIAMGRSRKRLSVDERESIKAEGGYRCACCGEAFPSDQLVLDHLIPISLLGADAPANLVAMSKSCNAKKWDRLLRGELKLYRNEVVRGRFGVRFVGGAFWPVINRRVRVARSAAQQRAGADGARS